MKHFRLSLAALTVGLAAALFTTGCEWDDEEYDHNPPAGQGSLIVDNYTSTDIEVFVDGVRLGEARNDRDRAFDLAPGVYRLVLNDEDDRRNWAGDVDVLEGRLTILTVRIDASDFDDYDVSREIQ